MALASRRKTELEKGGHTAPWQVWGRKPTATCGLVLWLLSKLTDDTCGIYKWISEMIQSRSFTVYYNRA